jgi:DNA-binding transcriptional MerR regulator
MRIGELSRRTGATVPTIKYYIREGLLPSGRPTAANQADYDESHVARLDLIRALREVAGLPVATIRATLEAMTAPGPDATAGAHVGVALAALSEPLDVPDAEAEAYATAGERVDAVLATIGWDVDADSTARADLVRAVVAIDRNVDSGASADTLAAYASAAAALAAHEIPDDWDPAGAPDEALRYAVLGTVLYEPVLTAMRRLAHADRHRRLTAGTGQVRT